MELDKFPIGEYITNRDVRNYLDKNFESVQSYLNICSTIEMIEKSNICGELTGDLAGKSEVVSINSDETNTIYTPKLCNSEEERFKNIEVDPILDVNVTIRGIGGYARSLIVNTPWRSESGLSSKYFARHTIDGIVTIYGKGEEKIDTILVEEISGKKISIKESVIKYLEKNQLKLNIKIGYNYLEYQGSPYGGYQNIQKADDWTVYSPKTQYLVPIE